MEYLFEENTICRLCLRVDVKLYKLDNTHQAFIENIIQLKRFYIATEEHYVCYICKALVSKTFNFIQSIWKAQKMICDLLKKTDMITKPMVEELIDRCESGLNPITLSAFVMYENEMIFDSCDDKNLDKNKINGESEVKEVQLLAKTEGIHSKQMQKYETNIKKIDEHPTNETGCIYISSSSDEDIIEPNKCYLDEIEAEINDPHVDNVNIDTITSDDPLEENNKESKKESTKNIKKNVCEDLKTVPLKRKTQLLQKTRSYKYKSDSQNSESESSNSNEKRQKRKKNDDDYQPDSTSHSEDSEYDSYDDEGKRIRKPKDNRVFPMKCDHCDSEVLSKSDHHHHYLFTHPNIEYPYKREKIYACSICGKLMAKHRIGSHERSHIKQENKCRLCPKIFLNRLLLCAHVLRVHPKKTFTCDYCSKPFKTRTDIMRHIRIHTGIKPFKCHICGDTFAHSGNRTIHIRSKHQNVRYVPKKNKRTQKVPKSNKLETTDSETTSSDEEKIRRKTKNTKTLRKNKKQSKSTTVTLKKKRKNTKKVSKNKKVYCSDTVMASKTEKQNLKRKKKTQNVGDCTDKNDIDADMNINKQKENRRNNALKHRNAETESDDEILAVIKSKKIKRNDGQTNSNDENLRVDHTQE